MVLRGIDRNEETVEAKDIVVLSLSSPSGDKSIVRGSVEGRINMPLLCVDGVELSGETETVEAPPRRTRGTLTFVTFI